MADEVNAFLNAAGLQRELGGQGKSVLEQSGAFDLDSLVEYVEEREDLKNLEEGGFKRIHVNMLFKAIIAERELRAAQASASAAAVPAASSCVKTPFSLLEKTVSTVPEHAVKDPSAYVAVKNVKLHEKTQQKETAKLAQEKKHQLEAAGPIKEFSGAKPFFYQSQAKEKKSTAPAAPDTFAKEESAFPGLPTPSKKSAATQERESEARKKANEAAALARQAVEAAAAANAAVAEHVRRIGPVQVGSRQFDRIVQFCWPRHMKVITKGKHELVDSPISALTNEGFQEAFLASLKAFCQRVGGKWSTPEIEVWYSFEPEGQKKGPRLPPHAVIIFEHEDDVRNLWHWYSHFKESPGEGKFMEIQGQEVMLSDSPNPRVVRPGSSHGSETASVAPSQAGSNQSHSSAAPAHRNLTLLFRNIPEQVASSTTQRPDLRQQIEKFVGDVLAESGLPFNRDLIKFSASFSTPRQPPPGCCWLNFSYSKIEGRRINTLGNKSGSKELDDGNAYELQAFIKHYRDAGRQESDSELQQLWIKCEDAVLYCEKLLSGGSRPISIATYFMDKLRVIDGPKRKAVNEKHEKKQDISLEERTKYIEGHRSRTWTTLMMGTPPHVNPVYVEFMRVAPR